MPWPIFKKEKTDHFLFREIDNAPLIVFRIIFGLLLFLESVGAIFTGWVRITLIEPDFTFSFIGFEWLQPLPGYGMYFYYALMGLFGLFVMIGYKYRWSLSIFTCMWTITYLMQKASYNNHYYLLIIICLIMLLLPANKYASIDAKKQPNIRSLSMPYWCTLIIIIQLFIVYTYASVAKIYPDWLDTSVVENLMRGKKNYFLIGEFLQLKWVHYVLSYMGIVFDLLIIPMLLWKPSRKIAFAAAIFFHLFNSIVLQIGIFPYLALAFTVFFFEPEKIRAFFFKKKPDFQKTAIKVPSFKNTFIILGIIYFSIQIALPLRHWFIKDDVLWTEEGHRMSWRMMLRTKRGYIQFRIVDKNTGASETINPKDYLSRKQQRMIGTKPDVIWQFAQRLKKDYNKQGKEVAIYVRGKVKINNRPYHTLIDPKIDLASTKWSAFKHHSWILASEKE